MKNQAVVTIVSNNYLHYARTLMQSVAKQHPEAKRYCVIVDVDPAPSRELVDEFEVIRLPELGLPFGDGFMFQYTILELNTAVKPWALELLLERGHSEVFYIDPDIYLYQPLTDVVDLLDKGASVVLTPHLLAPMTDDYNPTELAIRNAGTYNLGFCALSNQPAARKFLTWWQGKLERDCIVDFPSGIFVDQSWVDLAPGLFDHIAVLRHPGYNVAYWNIAQRDVAADGDQWTVNGQRLAFFHYSGIDPQHPEKLSKYQNRYTLNTVQPTVRELVLEYCNRVVENGLAGFRSLPYGYANFEDGTAITPDMRARYRLSQELRQKFNAQPFKYGKEFARMTPLPEPASTPSASVAQLMAPARLTDLYMYFLGRSPDASALKHLSSRVDGLFGYWRLVLSTGSSAEAREHPGWWRRLLFWPSQQVLGGRLLRNPSFARSTPSARLEDIYTYFLGRNPDAMALQEYPQLVSSSGGYWRLAVAVGKSDEARGNSGWMRRLALWPLWQVQQLAAPRMVTPQPREFTAKVEPVAAAPSPNYTEKEIGINLVGYIAAELGVGEAARSLARACTAGGIAYSVVDVGYQSSNLQRDTQALQNACDKRFGIDLVYVNADQTKTTIEYLQEKGLQSDYKIGFWHWEQPQLPHSHLAAFEHLKEIWVPSQFVQNAVAAVSPVPVVIIPHALSVKATPGVQRSQFGLPEDKLLALIMYDFHSYQHRKNPQAAIAAFRQAMQGRTDAVLVVKTINGHYHPEAVAELTSHLQDLAGTVIIDQFLTRQQTWDLQSCCDMLISLHRAEGFGLAPAEMMSLGKPVVATGWSANMDFMTHENSMPVRYTLKPLAETIGAYEAGPVWAEADIDHAASCIRQLLDQPELRSRLGKQAALDIERQLNPEAIGKLVRERLQAIGHWHPHLFGAA